MKEIKYTLWLILINLLLIGAESCIHIDRYGISEDYKMRTIWSKECDKELTKTESQCFDGFCLNCYDPVKDMINQMVKGAKAEHERVGALIENGEATQEQTALHNEVEMLLREHKIKF